MPRKSISKSTRQLVLAKYDGHCAYCGKALDLKTLRVDHLIPFKNGGIDDISNYMPSCHQCNFYKSVFTLDQFRDNLKTLHERVMKPFISRLGFEYGIVEIHPFDGKFYFEKLKEKIYIVTDGNHCYFEGWDDVRAIVILDGMVDYEDCVKKFDSKAEAQKVAEQLGWKVETKEVGQ